MDATTRTVERKGDGMSYRKHLMPNITPPAVYEATTVDSDTDTIGRKQAIDAISCDITITGRRNAEIVSETIASFVDRIKALPPAQPEKRTETHDVCLDAISRQAAIEAVQNRHMLLSKEKTLLINDLEKLPPVEPKRIRGKWIYHIDDLFPAESTMECNQCHAEQPLICDDEFCPKCGARMEGTE